MRSYKIILYRMGVEEPMGIFRTEDQLTQYLLDREVLNRGGLIVKRELIETLDYDFYENMLELQELKSSK